ncbi:unnamed protein product [Discula destructiva]
MFFRFPLLIVVFAFTAATTLAYPTFATWYLAVYQYRCKAPYHVEAFADEWAEWRVSSICAPGTCCSNSAATGPLCTVEACEAANEERERLLTSKNAIEAARKQMEQKQADMESAESKLAKTQKAEAEWKQKEAVEDALRAKTAEAQLV